MPDHIIIPILLLLLTFTLMQIQRYKGTPGHHIDLLWTLTQQVDLINDEDGYFLNITSVLPASAHSIPFLGGGDNEVSLRYCSHVWGDVACQFHHSAHRQEQGKKVSLFMETGWITLFCVLWL